MYYIPDHVSPAAKDLIRRMLIVDPEKRINMHEVINHPWFKSITPRNPNIFKTLKAHTPHGGPSSSVTINFQLSSPEDLDKDILNSLDLLGWDNEKELVDLLLSPQQNIEKVFYNLLLQRKWEYFENYDVDKLAEWDVEGGPRRRAESYTSLHVAGGAVSPGGSRFDLFKSEISLIRQNSTGSAHSLLGVGTSGIRDSCGRRSADELRSGDQNLDVINGGASYGAKSADSLNISENNLEVPGAGGSGSPLARRRTVGHSSNSGSSVKNPSPEISTRIKYVS
jgi:serine/threonine protein kinase